MQGEREVAGQHNLLNENNPLVSKMYVFLNIYITREFWRPAPAACALCSNREWTPGAVISGNNLNKHDAV